VIISAGGILTVLAGTGRIPPPDMITVFLLPPSYYFSKDSHPKRRLSSDFLPEIHGIIVLGGYQVIGTFH
jgi:hypothetical protein